MKIDDKINDEKLQYDIMILTENQQKHQHYSQVKLINMSILQVKKYYPLIKVEKYNKKNLHIPLLAKNLKNK